MNKDEKITRALEARTAELAKANEELAEANRTKDDFLATLSHELRTPLTSAFGWLQLLLAGGMTETQQRKALEVIDRNLRAQIKLIDDLLNVSHIAAGKIRLDRCEADALPIIRAAVDAVQSDARLKDVDLGVVVVNAMDSLACVVDSARLQQIVWNLLSNALKFTPRGGRVEVSVERLNDCLVLRVCDTGEGIPPEFLPHVFERFRQADSSQARKYGGLGIGLSVVRQLVELHGGIVEVQSEGKGKGALFTVSLPIGVSSNSTQRKPPQPA